MLEVVFKIGPYEVDGRMKYRIKRLSGIMRLLNAVRIPFVIKRIPNCDRFFAEIDGQTVYVCKLTNIEFDSDGSDFNSATAFEAIKEAFEAATRYYQRIDTKRIIYQERTTEKCFPITFDSFYLESFCSYKRLSSEEIKKQPRTDYDENYSKGFGEELGEHNEKFYEYGEEYNDSNERIYDGSEYREEYSGYNEEIYDENVYSDYNEEIYGESE